MSAPSLEERQVFADFLASRKLKRSTQREAIVETFLRSESHLTVDELYRLVRRRRPEIGRTTVYRTLKLLQEAGLAQRLEVDGPTKFERDYNREHHDHFICRGCGAIIEFQSPEIERAQDEIAARLGFVIEGHRHQIHGLCGTCSARKSE